MPVVPKSELTSRMQRLRKQLDKGAPEWRVALVFGKVNLYYLTGTMPSGVLVIPRDREATLWVRRSFTRSCAESAFPRIERMRSFRDIAAAWPDRPDAALVEREVLTLAHVDRMNKHLGFKDLQALDVHLGRVRAVKTEWELGCMERSGKIHREVLEEELPRMLREGISEAELGAEILACLIARGHQGVARVSMFDTELFLGNVCFGTSSIQPNPFDGPGGLLGVSPAVPLFASHSRCLRRGDLVYVDVACAVDGYHTDKTMTYAFGDLPAAAVTAQKTCVHIQNITAERLRPGAIPAEIHATVLADLDEKFLETFMGCGDQQVRFLGHGVGLHIDEMPVIANGFDEPLEANMTIALEPKQGLEGIGMVGIENTFVVSENGGRSLTGESHGLLAVG